MSYSFRFRIKLHPSSEIDIGETQISIPIKGGPDLLLLSDDENLTIKESRNIVVQSERYDNEEAAMEAALLFRDAITITSLEKGISSLFGLRTRPGGTFTRKGLDFLERKTRRNVINEAPGINIFETELKPLFPRIGPFHAVVSTPKDKFLNNLQKNINLGVNLTDKLRTAIELLNTASFLSSPDAKILILTAAIECLIEQQPRPDSVQLHLDSCIQEIESDANISENQKASIVGTLRQQKDESIRQAGLRLIRERLPGRQYMNMPADVFFDMIYEIRSSITHGTPPEINEVQKVVPELKGMLKELLISLSENLE